MLTLPNTRGWVGAPQGRKEKLSLAFSHPPGGFVNHCLGDATLLDTEVSSPLIGKVKFRLGRSRVVRV